jgi:hypothetical protein
MVLEELAMDLQQPARCGGGKSSWSVATWKLCNYHHVGHRRTGGFQVRLQLWKAQRILASSVSPSSAGMPDT